MFSPKHDNFVSERSSMGFVVYLGSLGKKKACFSKIHFQKRNVSKHSNTQEVQKEIQSSLPKGNKEKGFNS